MATSKKAQLTNGKAAPKKASPSNGKAAAKPIAKKTTTAAKPSVASLKMPTAIFNIDEINELLKAVNQSNVNELKLEKGDFKITIRQGMPMVTAHTTAQPVHTAPVVHSAPAPVAAAPAVYEAPAAAPVTAAPASDAPSADNLITIKSPMIGTFYRSAGPGKPTFVNVGDEIKVGQVICIVEAMKLFNEIESEVSGRVVKVLADDTSPVEYDQPLFLVEP